MLKSEQIVFCVLYRRALYETNRWAHWVLLATIQILETDSAPALDVISLCKLRDLCLDNILSKDNSRELVTNFKTNDYAPYSANTSVEGGNKCSISEIENEMKYDETILSEEKLNETLLFDEKFNETLLFDEKPDVNLLSEQNMNEVLVSAKQHCIGERCGHGDYKIDYQIYYGHNGNDSRFEHGKTNSECVAHKTKHRRYNAQNIRDHRGDDSKRKEKKVELKIIKDDKDNYQKITLYRHSEHKSEDNYKKRKHLATSEMETGPREKRIINSKVASVGTGIVSTECTVKNNPGTTKKYKIQKKNAKTQVQIDVNNFASQVTEKMLPEFRCKWPRVQRGNSKNKSVQTEECKWDSFTQTSASTDLAEFQAEIEKLSPREKDIHSNIYNKYKHFSCQEMPWKLYEISGLPIKAKRFTPSSLAKGTKNERVLKNSIRNVDSQGKESVSLIDSNNRMSGGSVKKEGVESKEKMFMNAELFHGRLLITRKNKLIAPYIPLLPLSQGILEDPRGPLKVAFP
ncbi:hypothetical protein SK128_000290 [Halocaridina rubra]|uniref:Uncharacterized protein n=1 Tax=Halocaridina rubra TaxID=373956 RepID=A0AAN8XHF0_HALRR